MGIMIDGSFYSVKMRNSKVRHDVYCRSLFSAIIIPRALVNNYDLLGWSIKGFKPSEQYFCLYGNEEVVTECSSCEYLENCDGQLCLFAMM